MTEKYKPGWRDPRKMGELELWAYYHAQYGKHWRWLFLALGIGWVVSLVVVAL